jgi:tRNA pseudouridine38-40 synthase
MQKYKIIISYDGTNYYGWQEQRDLVTVTQVLQDTFARVFKKSIKILGASRTDAGVHAQGQVALFYSDLAIDPGTMLRAWNNALPDDIVIKSLSHADDNFHPWFNVIQKTYHYHIFLNTPQPFIQRYGWFYSPRVNIDKLNDALQLFVGTHDFSAFCSIDVPDPNKIRTVNEISVEYIESWQAYRVTIVAQKFLRYMIRRMIGAALKVATCPEIPVDYIRTALDKKNPNNMLPTAAAKGLTLYHIEYGIQNTGELDEHIHKKV